MLLSSAVVELAVDGVHIADGALQLVLTGAIALEQLLALQLEADRRKRIPREPLDAVHGDSKHSRFLEAGSIGRLHHRRCSHDASGERRQSRDNKAAVHEQGADEQCQDAHTRKSRKADHNGLPLLQQLLDADHGAHVRNQQIDTDCAAKGNQYGVADQRSGKDCPVAHQNDSGSYEYRWNPCFCCRGNDLANDVHCSAEHKR